MKNIRDPFQNWSEPESLSAWGKKWSPPIERAWLAYLSDHASADMVISVARLLFPSFVEYESGVFLETNFNEASYLNWMGELGDIERVEALINHQHVYDLFPTPENTSEASYQDVANLMAQTLHLALRECFPDRMFNIRVSNSERDYGPTVTFSSSK